MAVVHGEVSGRKAAVFDIIAALFIFNTDEIAGGCGYNPLLCQRQVLLRQFFCM